MLLCIASQDWFDIMKYRFDIRPFLRMAREDNDHEKLGILLKMVNGNDTSRPVYSAVILSEFRKSWDQIMGWILTKPMPINELTSEEEIYLQAVIMFGGGMGHLREWTNNF